MRKIPVLSLLYILALPAAEAEWRGTGDSEFTFEVTFEGEPLAGTFREFDVSLEFEPGALDAARLHVTVDLDAADMGDPDMNSVLFDPAWFDVEQFAEAVFVSDSITQQQGEGFAASGTLDLKGNERPVTVPFTWQRSGDRATMRGGLIIKRTDFGVGDGEWATDDSIGIDVKLAFEVQLVRQD